MNMVPDISETASRKQDLRRRMRMQRRALTEEDAAARSARAQMRLLESPLWKEARDIALYASYAGELSTDMLLERCILEKKALWLPRVVRGSQGSMVFCRIRGADDLESGSFGILEPKGTIDGCGPGDERFNPDLVVVPGLAFDRRGMRLGYGGGYYDRFLDVLPSAAHVGLCFACQMVEEVPVESWDSPMTHIATEEGVVAAEDAIDICRCMST